jgi:hypothetical protein
MTIKKFDNIAEFEKKSWQEAMAQQGAAMKKSKVRKVVFVHGTFAGDDPLGIFRLMRSWGIPSVATNMFEDIGKKIIDKNMDDLGNFTDDYISSYAAGVELGYNKDCMTHNWSSENNHIGRLLAVPELAAKIAAKTEGLLTNDKILLIGHSHAGQLFALLTIFLEKGEKANALVNVLINADRFDKETFSSDIEKISNINLDIVTLGTPVRYPWGEYDKYRLLNIVNHRSDSKISGVLNTKNGDYVQQWATEGTDLHSPNASLDECNDKLDSILDQGRLNTNGLHEKLKENKRRQPINIKGEEAGKTIFVDYLDNGRKVFQMFHFTVGKPNFFKTLFGHGVYTRRNSMLFNTRLIVENFYS